MLPLFHALAQVANLLMPLVVGARIVYLETLNTTELLRALSERGITLFCCVPQFFYLIHERVMQQVKARPAPARLAFRAMMAISAAARKLGLNPGKLFFRPVHRLLGPKMRYFITGGSAFDPKVGRDIEKLGFSLLQAYGLTETSGGATVTPPRANVMGSVGQPLKGVQVKIVDPQPSEGMPYPVGEIAISGDIIMKGYYNRVDATAETIRDGWLYSGDLGYQDERGNLFITGRKKEIIVLSSGKNIYPEELEAQYLRSPFIKEICVMGLVNRPGEPFSERLHAVIVPDFDVLRERKIVNTREVIRFDVENLSMELPSTKRILSFDLWSDPLPRTTTRKLKRFEIQRRVMAGEGGAAGSAGGVAEEPTGEEAAWLASAGSAEGHGGDSRREQSGEAGASLFQSRARSGLRFHGARGTGGGAGARDGGAGRRKSDRAGLHRPRTGGRGAPGPRKRSVFGFRPRVALPAGTRCWRLSPTIRKVLAALNSRPLFTFLWFVVRQSWWR